MSFNEFFKEYCKDLDVWNMSLEEYNYHKKEAKRIFDSMKGEKQ